MEKRNTLLLTVIAVATLLVAVVGATFAYFASSNAENLQGVNVTATTEAANAVFSATGGSIALANVTTVNMQQTQAGVFSDSDSANLEVSFLAGGTTERYCTYDIAYKWTDTTANGTYTISEISGAPATQEFTYTITSSSNYAGTSTQVVGTVSETNFVATDSAAHNVLTAQKIYNGSTSDATVNTYNVEAKFYNINAEQNANAGKTFKLEFYVTNVVC